MLISFLLDSLDQPQSIFRHRILRFTLFLALGLNIGLWVLLLFQLKDLEANIPLHYNIYFGIDAFGSKYNLFFLPGLGLAVLALNSVGAVYLWVKEKLLSYFLVGINLLVQIILLIATLTILFVNS